MQGETFRWRWVWLALLALVTIWFFWRLRGVLLPFILAGGIAYLLNPLVDRLVAKGWSRNRSIAFIMLVLLAFGLLVFFLVMPPLAAEIANAIENYDPIVKQAEELYSSALARVQQAVPWAFPHQRLPEDIKAQITNYGRGLLARTPALLTKLLQSIAGFLFLLVLTLVLSFWFLKEYHTIGRRLLAFVPAHYISTVSSLTRQINRLVSAYLTGQLILAAVAAIAATIIMFAFGVDYAIFIGLLAGALYMIPYFGVPAAMAIAVIVSAVTGHTWLNILGMVGCLVALNVSLDYIVTPRVIGNRVKLHPLTIIFAIIAVGELFGFLGVFIAVPLAAATKAVLVTFFPEFFDTSVNAGL